MERTKNASARPQSTKRGARRLPLSRHLQMDHNQRHRHRRHHDQCHDDAWEDEPKKVKSSLKHPAGRERYIREKAGLPTDPPTAEENGKHSEEEQQDEQATGIEFSNLFSPDEENLSSRSLSRRQWREAQSTDGVISSLHGDPLRRGSALVPIASEVTKSDDWEERFYELQERVDNINTTNQQRVLSTAEAVPLHEGDEHYGRPQNYSKIANSFKKWWSSRRIQILGVILIFLVAGAVALTAVLITESTSSSSSPDAPPGSPTVAPMSPNPWQQIGQDLAGESSGDRAGASVSLSRDASTLAVGAPQIDTKASNPGYVSVYLFNPTSQSWIPMGQPLIGKARGDEFGKSVYLNGAGNVLAVGAPYNNDGGTQAGMVRVYFFDEIISTWVQLGNDIVGVEGLDNFGIRVCLSEDGQTLAVGAHNSDVNGPQSGSVRVFRFNRDIQSWQQLGQRLLGRNQFDYFGFALSLNSSGMIVAIGAYGFNHPARRNAGQVYTFQLNPATIRWDSMGAPQSGQAIGDRFGFRVSLSDSGLVMAVTSLQSEVGGNGLGSVSVFDHNNDTSSWTRRGQALLGKAAGDEFGSWVSLSSDGNTVGIGARGHDGKGLKNAGQVKIFGYNAIQTKWVQVGRGLTGVGADDQCGRAVSLARNASVVAIGCRLNDFNGNNSGHVRVFALD